ncbi:hypothetical protein FSP39_020443 [Pinctada imbricata]|uniref:Uncharacterized protein n=1 Tax=Pinctada imbricata TaxID=66713 RepID=A0AA88YKB5_PINIB|nr:hypothetical protein FSP39_020443 [Pinctada imbricata]
MNANFNANNPSRVFKSISTSGVIFASHCGNGECIAQAVVKKNMKWYVDKAVWENLLVHLQQNQAGGFTSQSAMQNLLNKVKTGRKVRLHINDYSDLDIFVNADHVTIDGGTSTTDASSVNHLYVTPGVSIPMSPDWQFLYVTTASYNAVIVRMNYFIHQQTFEDEREVETTWFVN